jgi:hypothetical protein
LPSQTWSAPTTTPGHEAPAPPDPVWDPEPKVTPKLATTLGHATEVAPPEIPNWERAAPSTWWPDSRWEHATETTLPRQGVRPGPKTIGGQLRQSRAITAAVAAGFLVLVFVAGAFVLASLHHSPATPTGPAASTSTASAADVGRILAATNAALAANTSAQTKLRPGSGFPTIATVAKVINPYVAALQHYEAALVDIPVPDGARTDAVSEHALVAKDVQFLGTINGLPSLRLGTYLEEFGKDAEQLQITLGSLQRELKAPSF